jgi:hypothetical protein
VVLIALMMIALIAFTGVAIDGGGLLLLYRDAQNASDAAVLSATYAMCTDAGASNIINAGIAAAADNGFTTDGTTVVNVNNPPTAGLRAGDNDFVEVVINAQKTSYFIHLVFPGPLAVGTRAVGYCIPPFNPYTWPAITALGVCPQDELNWSGSNSYISGGMHSNGTTFVQGSDNTVDNGTAESVDTFQTSASGNVDFLDGDPVDGVPPLDDPQIYRIGDYAPGGAKAESVGLYWSPDTDTAGVYFNSDTWDGTEWDLGGNPAIPPLAGLYYVPGNVKIGQNVDFDLGVGTSIVTTGTINVNNDEPSTYYVDGLMYFSSYDSPDCSSWDVDLQASSVTWQGVVYAPDSNIKVSGSQITVNPGAIIGYRIDLSGSRFTLIYDPEILEPRPPMVLLAE